jgi:hypothetical protein
MGLLLKCGALRNLDITLQAYSELERNVFMPRKTICFLVRELEMSQRNHQLSFVELSISVHETSSVA